MLKDLQVNFNSCPIEIIDNFDNIVFTDYKPIYNYKLDNIDKKGFYCIDLNFMNRFFTVEPKNNSDIIHKFLFENRSADFN